MCKYCEPRDKFSTGNAIWFRKEGPLFSKQEKKKKKLACIVNCESNCGLLDKGPILSVQGETGDTFDWYDFRINYCPRCEKQLRKNIIPEYKNKLMKGK